MRNTLAMFKQDILNYLIDEVYGYHDDEKSKIIRKFGDGKVFQFNGKEYSPYQIHGSFVKKCLTWEERKEFTKYVNEWEELEYERAKVKQHITNYMNSCRTVADVYHIVPEEMHLKNYKIDAIPVMPIKRYQWYRNHELMEVMLDRRFLQRLE